MIYERSRRRFRRTWGDGNSAGYPASVSRATDRNRRRRWASRLGLVLILAGILSLVEVGLTVFPTRTGTTLSRDALEHRPTKHAAAATESCPSLRAKRITAHVLRHTAAMRLLLEALAK